MGTVIRVGVPAAAMIALVVLTFAFFGRESDVCFAIFQNESVAAEAVTDADAIGIDAESDVRRSTVAATFEAASNDFEGSFEQFVDAHDGRLGHPGTGCTTTRVFD